MTPIHLRNLPGLPETFDHISFIKNLCLWVKPENYLEIGVREGKCLQEVAEYCKVCHAVDLKFDRRDFGSNILYYEMSSDDFFAQNRMQFDFVFIDGDHSKEQVLKDFTNVESLVMEEGFVLLHDTSPCWEEFLEPGWCNNAWEAALEIKNNFNQDWEIVTLPFNPGLTIMKKIKISKQLSWK